MTTQLEAETHDDASAAATPLGRSRRILTANRLVYAGYLLAAGFLMSGLWLDPLTRHHSDNPGDDQVLFEWMLGHTAHAIAHADNPLVSGLMNTPWGVNLMANTSAIAIGVVLAPVTWLFGAATSYAVAMTVGLFGTAAGWYHLLRHHLRLSTLAAVVGGALCGFGPATVAHANGHLNFTALLCVPFIVIAIMRMREPGRAVRGGATLGGLLVVEIFIGEEVVFLIAVFMTCFAVVYAMVD
ncbi:MAG: glycosyl transferase, partial [Stackebrandtia sp.]